MRVDDPEAVVDCSYAVASDVHVFLLIQPPSLQWLYGEWNHHNHQVFDLFIE